jgi:hypothetical protein
MRKYFFIAATTLSVACKQSGEVFDTSRAKPVDSPRAAVSVETTQATPNEQCVRGEPEPALEPKVQAVFQRTSKLEATEDARIADTLSLLIRHGGCVHFSEIYAFTIAGAANNTADSQRWLRLGAQMLRRLDVVEVKTSQMEGMAGAMEKAADATPPYIYGDPISVSEMVTLYVTARPVRNGVVMEITYSNTL